MSEDYKYLNFFAKLIRVTLVTLVIYGLILPTSIVFANNLATLPFLESNIHQLIARQVNGWETANADQIIADFAEDGLFIVPGSTSQGKQAIKQAVENYFANYTDTKITVKRIVFNGKVGAVEWDWQQKKKETGEISLAEDAIIFELENGKIQYWREYIDTKSAS
ncbi:MAG: nuclear transport factor 2 family protein [Oscillatoria sp. PMC 1051.18]|nr:nuclear transport factor 2 family protein [Oscillatoria sp. PMC 1050.18]MEC5030410.1 nuclear transport factor 2 family protein [Oscillatoria sp. PMC 1051.18]